MRKLERKLLFLVVAEKDGTLTFRNMGFQIRLLATEGMILLNNDIAFSEFCSIFPTKKSENPYMLFFFR